MPPASVRAEKTMQRSENLNQPQSSIEFDQVYDVEWSTVYVFVRGMAYNLPMLYRFWNARTRALFYDRNGSPT